MGFSGVQYTHYPKEARPPRAYFSSSSNAYEIGSARCAGGLGRERNFKIIMILDFLEPALSLLSPPNIMAE